MLRKAALFFSFLLLWAGFIRGQIRIDHALAMGQNALYYEDYMLSIQYFNRAIESRPYLAQPYFFRGLAKFRLGDYSGTVEDCTEAIRLNPYFSDSYRLRAIGWIELARYDSAVADYRHVLSVSPHETVALYNMSLCYMNLKDYEAARKSLDELDRYSSNDKNKIWLMRADISLNEGDTLQAVECVDHSLEYDSLQADAWGFKASLSMQHEEWEKAEQEWTKAIRCSGNRNADLHVNRALARYYLWRYDDALADYDEAIRINPRHVVAHYNRGLLRMNVGDNNRAIEDFDFILSLQPDNETALVNRGILRLKTGDAQGAITDFTNILKRHPNFLAGYYYRAEAYRRAGRAAAAARDEAKLMKADLDMRFGGNNWRTGGKPQPARKLSDMDIEDYDQVAENETSASDAPEYKSEFRGRIQNRTAEAVPRSPYLLSFYHSVDDFRPTAPYYRQLEALNNKRIFSTSFYLNCSDKALTAAQVQERFVSIDSLSRRIEKVLQLQAKSASAFSQEERNFSQELLALLFTARSVDYMLTHDLESALADADQAVAADTALLWPYFQRASVRFKIYRLQKDRASFSSSGLPAESLQEQSLPAVTLSEVCADWELVCRKAPDFPHAYYNKGLVLALMGRTGEALAAYDEAIRLDSSLAEAYFNRALLLMERGDEDDRTKAFSDLSRAGELGIPQAYSLIKFYSK